MRHPTSFPCGQAGDPMGYYRTSQQLYWYLIPLKNIKNGWYLREDLFSPKTILLSETMEVHSFCQQDETVKHLFFQCQFAMSDQSSK
jgi:hypothetical protein